MTWSERGSSEGVKMGDVTSQARPEIASRRSKLSIWLVGVAGVLVVEFNQLISATIVGPGYLPVWLFMVFFIGAAFGLVAGIVTYVLNRVLLGRLRAPQRLLFTVTAAVGTIVFAALLVFFLSGYDVEPSWLWWTNVLAGIILVFVPLLVWAPGSPAKVR
jgi:hypothetical protein